MGPPQTNTDQRRHLHVALLNRGARHGAMEVDRLDDLLTDLRNEIIARLEDLTLITRVGCKDTTTASIRALLPQTDSPASPRLLPR